MTTDKDKTLNQIYRARSPEMPLRFFWKDHVNAHHIDRVMSLLSFGLGETMFDHLTGEPWPPMRIAEIDNVERVEERARAIIWSQPESDIATIATAAWQARSDSNYWFNRKIIGNAVMALLAWPESGHLMTLPSGVVVALSALGDDSAILMAQAIIVLERAEFLNKT